MEWLTPQLSIIIIVNVVALIGVYWKLRMDLQEIHLTVYTKSDIDKWRLDHMESNTEAFKEINTTLHSMDKKLSRVIDHLKIPIQEEL